MTDCDWHTLYRSGKIKIYNSIHSNTPGMLNDWSECLKKAAIKLTKISRWTFFVFRKKLKISMHTPQLLTHRSAAYIFVIVLLLFFWYLHFRQFTNFERIICYGKIFFFKFQRIKFICDSIDRQWIFKLNSFHLLFFNLS